MHVSLAITRVKYALALACGPAGKKVVPRYVRQLSKIYSIDDRQSAAIALGDIGSHAGEAIPALVTALDDPRVIVRASVAEALGKIRIADKSVIEALTAALKDEYIIVRRKSASALGKLGAAAKSAVPGLTALQQDKSQVVRRAANEALNVIKARNN